jgi:hypothetical protein
MSKIKKLFVSFLLATVLGGTFAVPSAVQASAVGRRNTAIGLSAGTLFSLFSGHTTAGIVGAAGSLYAWKRYNDERRQEDWRYHRGYPYGYGRGYGYGYPHGYGYRR